MFVLRSVTWFIESAPRVIVQLSSLAALGVALGACAVPAARYEEALSAASVEQAGHRRTLARLYEVEQKLAAAEAVLREQERRLGERDELVAAAQLETSVAAKERESASELVEQLRGELGRVGDHLKTYASERGELATELEAAEARVSRLVAATERLDDVGRVVRDLSLLLGESLVVGESELELVEGRPRLRVGADRIWAGAGDELLPQGKKLVELMGKLASQHPQVRFELVERGAGGEASLRLRRLVDALVAQGIAADRAVIRMDERPTTAASPDAPAEPKLEIAVEIAPRLKVSS
jgi:hypothetical protein